MLSDFAERRERHIAREEPERSKISKCGHLQYIVTMKMKMGSNTFDEWSEFSFLISEYFE